MKAIIKPGPVSGKVNIPPSKSLTQRAYAAALLYEGTILIGGQGHSEDEEAAFKAIQQLGATPIYKENEFLRIKGGISPITNMIDCGESGLCARLLIPIAALHNEPLTITGHGSLMNRTMHFYEEILPQLGVEITTTNGCLPVTVKGPLSAKNITIDGSVSSQFLSGLLYAFSYAATEPVTITVNDLVSKAYADLTVYMLQNSGKTVTHEAYKKFHIPARVDRKNEDSTRILVVDKDWSSAATMLTAGAIAGSVQIQDDVWSRQPDAQIVNILQQAGARLERDVDPYAFREEIVYSSTIKKDQLNAFSFDATDAPDLFPVLAILAAVCKGESSIKGLHRLHHKESNREIAVCTMLDAFGVQWHTANDSLFITGQEQLKVATINSFNDHRIVMAAAIAALSAEGPVTIEDAAAINKSYPDFFRDLVALGAELTLIS